MQSFFYMPEMGGAGGSGGDGGSDDQGSDGEMLTFDTWVAKQPEDIQTLLSGHQRGLKSALDTERETRKGLEKQLKDLASKADKGSELEKQLNELAGQQASATLKAEFYESAHSQGVTNLKLAFIVAQQDELIDSKGRVNFDEMKRRYPELFGAAKSRADGNAGNGAGGGAGNGTVSMNDFIRQAAGRK